MAFSAGAASQLLAAAGLTLSVARSAVEELCGRGNGPAVVEADEHGTAVLPLGADAKAAFLSAEMFCNISGWWGLICALLRQ